MESIYLWIIECIKLFKHNLKTTHTVVSQSVSIGLTTGTPPLFRVFSVSISIGETQDREAGSEPYDAAGKRGLGW